MKIWECIDEVDEVLYLICYIVLEGDFWYKFMRVIIRYVLSDDGVIFIVVFNVEYEIDDFEEGFLDEIIEMILLM